MTFVQERNFLDYHKKPKPRALPSKATHKQKDDHMGDGGECSVVLAGHLVGVALNALT